MSSRSSCSEIWRRSQSSATSSRRPRAAGVDQDRRERDQAREALGPDRGLAAARRPSVAGSSGRRSAPAARPRAGELRLAGVAARSSRSSALVDARRTSSGGPSDAGVLAQAEHPGDELARVRVVACRRRGRRRRSAQLAVAAEVALDQPGDALGDPAPRPCSTGSPSCQSDAVGVLARVEVLGPLEVVLGLGGVGDLAADAREPEDAQRRRARASGRRGRTGRPGRAAGRGRPCASPVASRLHRVVVEDDRLAAEDRRLDLGQALGELVPAGRRGDRRARPSAGRARAAGCGRPHESCWSARRSGSA